MHDLITTGKDPASRLIQISEMLNNKNKSDQRFIKTLNISCKRNSQATLEIADEACSVADQSNQDAEANIDRFFTTATLHQPITFQCVKLTSRVHELTMIQHQPAYLLINVQH